jgi:hypothetical protein
LFVLLTVGIGAMIWMLVKPIAFTSIARVWRYYLHSPYTDDFKSCRTPPHKLVDIDSEGSGFFEMVRFFLICAFVDYGLYAIMCFPSLRKFVAWTRAKRMIFAQSHKDRLEDANYRSRLERRYRILLSFLFLLTSLVIVVLFFRFNPSAVPWFRDAFSQLYHWLGSVLSYVITWIRSLSIFTPSPKSPPSPWPAWPV